jgi:hypothetical protein
MKKRALIPLRPVGTILDSHIYPCIGFSLFKCFEGGRRLKIMESRVGQK